MMKKFTTVIALAAAHLAISKFIVFTAMQIDMFAADAGRASVALGKTLVVLTRVLYFPIITLSLYSRHMFPGHWIYVPICANSLIWGVFIAVVFWWWRKRTKTG